MREELTPLSLVSLHPHRHNRTDIFLVPQFISREQKRVDVVPLTKESSCADSAVTDRSRANKTLRRTQADSANRERSLPTVQAHSARADTHCSAASFFPQKITPVQSEPCRREILTLRAGNRAGGQRYRLRHSIAIISESIADGYIISFFRKILVEYFRYYGKSSRIKPIIVSASHGVRLA